MVCNLLIITVCDLPSTLLNERQIATFFFFFFRTQNVWLQVIDRLALGSVDIKLFRILG